MATSRRLVALAATLLLASCKLGADVAVEQAGGRATVQVSRDGPACIRNLTVYEGEPNDPPAWNIVGGPRTPCTTRIQLGQVPAGFDPDPGRSTLTLKPGQTYVVAVDGVSWSAGARFVAQP